VRLGFDSVWSAEELYLDGRKREAAGAVPDELVDEVALVGPGERIAEGLERGEEAGVDALIVGTHQVDALRVLAEARG
jgi:alkanesulfonate monooxygenase SsuD/methylene tetrahydromethanopterin reductase-like flavin-dependent oxidoreductase (luciferase family)